MNIIHLGILKENEYSKYIELADNLLSAQFTAKDLGSEITSRKLNTWFNDQLLMNQREKGEWSVFNFIEYIWVQIVSELRNLEVNSEIIKRLKDSLLEPVEWLTLMERGGVVEEMFKIIPLEHREAAKALLKDKEFLRKEGIELRVSIFFMIVLDCLIDRTNTSIMFNSKGDWCPVKDSRLDQLWSIDEFKELFHSNHISISLTNIISQYLKKSYIDDEKLKIALLTKTEEIVIKKIRQGGVKSLTIQFSNDNQMEFLESTRIQKIDAASRLIELIMANGYQGIRIKTVKGKVVYYENTIKERIQEVGTSKSEDRIV
jgi:hypothetical protein